MATILHTHKDNQVAEHCGHSLGKERSLPAEILLGFCSGRLHTQGIANTYVQHLAYYGGDSCCWDCGSHFQGPSPRTGPIPGNCTPGLYRGGDRDFEPDAPDPRQGSAVRLDPVSRKEKNKKEIRAFLSVCLFLNLTLGSKCGSKQLPDNC